MAIIVDVVSGVDWTAIAAAGATAVAAVGGIWGTAHQAKRAREATSEDLQKNLEAAADNVRLSIKADNMRARYTERRKLYADCQAAFTTMLMILLKHRQFYTSDANEQQYEDDVYVAFEKTNGISWEVRLIASDEVSELAYKFTETCINFVRGTHKGSPFGPESDDIHKLGESIGRLQAAMRKELEAIESLSS